jgi:hypothetical protein
MFFMDDLLKQLAADASIYLQELRRRDVPLDLSYQLVRDWHQSRLASYYGLAQSLVTVSDPSTTLPPQDAIDALMKLRLRDVSLPPTGHANET